MNGLDKHGVTTGSQKDETLNRIGGHPTIKVHGENFGVAGTLGINSPGLKRSIKTFYAAGSFGKIRLASDGRLKIFYVAGSSGKIRLVTVEVRIFYSGTNHAEGTTQKGRGAHSEVEG